MVGRPADRVRSAGRSPAIQIVNEKLKAAHCQWGAFIDNVGKAAEIIIENEKRICKQSRAGNTRL